MTTDACRPRHAHASCPTTLGSCSGWNAVNAQVRSRTLLLVLLLGRVMRCSSSCWLCHLVGGPACVKSQEGRMPQSLHRKLQVILEGAACAESSHASNQRSRNANFSLESRLVKLIADLCPCHRQSPEHGSQTLQFQAGSTVSCKGLLDTLMWIPFVSDPEIGICLLQ